MIGADEMSLLPLVASGDREACAVMRDGLLMAAQTATAPMLRADAMSKAEVLSRMAAATGDAGDHAAPRYVGRANHARGLGRTRLCVSAVRHQRHE